MQAAGHAGSFQQLPPQPVLHSPPTGMQLRACMQALAGLEDPADARSPRIRTSTARIFACVTRYGQVDSVAASLMDAISRSEHLSDAAGTIAHQACQVYQDPCLVSCSAPSPCSEL